MKRTSSFLKAAILGTLVLVASQSFAFDFTHLVVRTATDAVFSQGKKLVGKATEKSSITVPATGTIEVAFSPDESSPLIDCGPSHSQRTCK